MRVMVTGAYGFLGRYVCKELRKHLEEQDILRVTSSNYEHGNINDNHIHCNLLEEHSILGYYDCDVVIHLAAKVGGIGANAKNPAVFMRENLQMGLNLFDSIHFDNVSRSRNTKIVNVGTVCSYPKFCQVPFREEDLWNGYPEETNAPYGIAKKTLMLMLQTMYEQYGLRSANLILANLYGPGDSLDLENNHVIPAMIRKFLEAEKSGTDVELWGDGSPTREFLYVEDAAEAIVKVALSDFSHFTANVGTGVETDMQTLAHMIEILTAFTGKIKWDKTKPNGQPRRSLSTSRMRNMYGWDAKTKLYNGLSKTVEDIKCRLEL